MDQTTEQNSPNTIWYVIAIVVVASAVLWYFYGKQAPSTTNIESTAAVQTQNQASAGNNTTADISSDLMNQVPDYSADLNADAAAMTSDIQSI
jgi:uncharacterized protein HemX